ncbi:MAG: 50S ribosomal protein L24 [Candidatus Omnitrophica bacterium]|nr:50S ribosomal protein L24 [Candidatus Omnitrophota bacterium]
MLGIKKNDVVVVIAGKDKGKSGKVIGILREENRLVIEGINVVKKAVRKTQQNPNGGFNQIERPIHISNVMLMDKKLNKPTRFGTQILADGTKIRISKKSSEAI